MCGEAREIFVRDVASIDADAFGDRDEVRGSVETGAHAARATDILKHRGGRAFAVRARDLDGRVSPFGRPKRGEKLFDVGETEFDRDGFVTETQEIFDRLIELRNADFGLRIRKPNAFL